MNRTAFVLFFLLGLLIAKGENLNYGLYFSSFSNLAKERTSVILNNNEALRINNELTVSFELFIRDEPVYGNVIRVVNNSNEYLALDFSVDDRDNRYPNFVINESLFPVSNKIKFGEWIPVKIQILPLIDSIYLFYDDIVMQMAINLNKWRSVNVSFGACPFPGFQTSQVPPMNIRNIRVFNKKKLIRHWELKKHYNETCFDLIKGVPLVLQNPHWIIDSHRTWTQIYNKKFDVGSNPQYAFSAEKNCFFIVTNDNAITVFDAESGNETQIHVKGGRPAGRTSSQLIYDNKNDELVSYNLDDKTLSRFSFITQSWSEDVLSGIETGYWHHSASLDQDGEHIYTFGGYGYYKYNNDLYKINIKNKQYNVNKLLSIIPRYSSATVINEDTLYIFGGRGSVTGKQEINPHNLLDLYAVNLKTLEIKQLWSLTNKNQDWMPCGNLIYNEKQRCFYAMTDMDGGKLLKISMDNPEVTEVSNSMGVSSEADFLFYSLYLSDNQDKLYSLYCSNFNKSPSEISIFSMDYLPMTYDEIMQSPPTQFSFKKYVLALVLLALFLWVMFLIFKNIRNSKYLRGIRIKPKIQASTAKKESDELHTASSESINQSVTPLLVKTDVPFFDRSRSCVSFLGGFNIFDKNGKNITGEFTPILKSLFLLISLHSILGDKGINDSKIDAVLWFDKDSKSARNNRNVSLTRLKSLIESIGGVALIKHGSYWKIQFEESTFCDVYHVSKLIKSYNANEDLGDLIINKLLELFSYGPLLPNTHQDWLDKFKADYSNEVIDIICNLLQNKQLSKDENIMIQLADTLFLFDSLHEEALKIKCTILYQTGKIGLAKLTYDTFKKEYMLMLGENYKYTFSEVVSTKNSSL